MRTEDRTDLAPVPVVEPATPSRTTVSGEVEAYVDSARRLELMALDLAQRNAEEKEAVRTLIEGADGDIRVMRRAHRHVEQALVEQWPAGPTLIRAFDLLSAGRLELQARQSSNDDVVLQPLTALPANSRGRQLRIDDLVDEASVESFPASDAPSFWAR